MIWNEHSKLEGKHALFSASKWSWINYDMERMLDMRDKSYATTIGTLIHKYAADKITCMQKLKKHNKSDIKFELLRNKIPHDVVDRYDVDRVFDILQVYVNDSIGFHMKPEQMLFYSMKFFGTADSISYREQQLKIFDFKSGETPAHIEQLMIYAALFCLEYSKRPTELDMELRLYQSPEVLVVHPDASDIVPIMDKIITADKKISKLEV